MASPFTTSSPVPLPSPPFLSIPNLSNLRDCALLPPSGLPITSTTKVRPGILFRSAEVSRLTAQDWDAVKKVGVGRVFDLRSKPEVEKAWKAGKEEGVEDGGKEEGGVGMKEMEGELERVMGDVKREWVPVFEESDYSPERLAERYLKYMGEGTDGFVQAYNDILRHAGPSFRTILLYLSSIPPPSASSTVSASPPYGALIHCTAGKDRTGIFIAILLSYLGVSPTLIANEYNLTETGLAHVRDAIVERLIQSTGFKAYTQSLIQGRKISGEEIAKVLGMKESGGKEGGTGGKGELGEQEKKEVEMGRQAALRMVGARKEAMIAALEMVEREWGSAEGYLRNICGLGDKELGGLKSALVVPQG